jgi:hypothetical protein
MGVIKANLAIPDFQAFPLAREPPVEGFPSGILSFKPQRLACLKVINLVTRAREQPTILPGIDYPAKVSIDKNVHFNISSRPNLFPLSCFNRMKYYVTPIPGVFC